MINEFIKKAMQEDVGRGDLFERVSEPIGVSGKIIARSEGVLAGVLYADSLTKLEGFEIRWNCGDGDSFDSGDILATIDGDSHTIMRCERTLLNILHHASSIATMTQKYVDIVEPYDVMMLDTRKTRPMLREFEKYASRMGGAVNHRMGLDDALMLKDTHMKTIVNLKAYLEAARKHIPFTAKIEVECESFDDAVEAMEAGADIVMCDNMESTDIKNIVEHRNGNFPTILLEASGNITLETIEEIAITGVDAISSGSMIHQAQWVDLSIKID